MSLLRTLDRTSAVSNCSHARPILAFLCPVLSAESSRRAFSKKTMTSSPPCAQDRVEHVFIHALVRAGTCSRHAKHMSTSRRTQVIAGGVYRASRDNRASKTARAHEQDQPDAAEGSAQRVRRGFRNFAEKELRALVDYYGIELDTRPPAEPDDDGGLIWNIGNDHVPWPLRDEGDAVHIERLVQLLHDEESSHDIVFNTYRQLPTPGVVYLDTATIRALLHHLSVLERPTPIAMQRFLSVLDDMKMAHIHIIRSEWTTAIHLAGRAMSTMSVDDMQASLRLWHDMEYRAGLKGSIVTLNVLFNVAVMAGKYTLAETFLKEMQARRLPVHRHHRVSKIYYYGVLQDGNAVRKTYQDLVASGDIVDTTVMNAVMAALIRAGEPSAAEHVFERMKRLHASRTTPAPGHQFFMRTWRQRRSLGLLLTNEAFYLNHVGEKDKLRELQDYAPIAPDSRTYALMIRHQSSTIGNFDRVYELLQEMRHNAVPLEGTIFIVIFRGFHSFGGVRYTAWTRDKLEKIWAQYLKALGQGLERTWLSSLAIVAVLRAFGKVTDAERTLKAWQELRRLWQPNEEELETVLKVLRSLVPVQTPTGFFNENPDHTL